jgi:hypothetical protein
MQHKHLRRMESNEFSPSVRGLFEEMNRDGMIFILLISGIDQTLAERIVDEEIIGQNLH